MAPKLGVHEGHVKLFDVRLQSPFGQVKIFPNDPKLLEQLGFGPIFSVMIEAGNPENFRKPYYRDVNLQ